MKPMSFTHKSSKWGLALAVLVPFAPQLPGELVKFKAKGVGWLTITLCDLVQPRLSVTVNE